MDWVVAAAAVQTDTTQSATIRLAAGTESPLLGSLS